MSIEGNEEKSKERAKESEEMDIETEGEESSEKKQFEKRKIRPATIQTALAIQSQESKNMQPKVRIKKLQVPGQQSEHVQDLSKETTANAEGRGECRQTQTTSLETYRIPRKSKDKEHDHKEVARKESVIVAEPTTTLSAKTSSSDESEADLSSGKVSQPQNESVPLKKIRTHDEAVTSKQDVPGAGRQRQSSERGSTGEAEHRRLFQSKSPPIRSDQSEQRRRQTAPYILPSGRWSTELPPLVRTYSDEYHRPGDRYVDEYRSDEPYRGDVEYDPADRRIPEYRPENYRRADECRAERRSADRRDDDRRRGEFPYTDERRRGDTRYAHPRGQEWR